MGLYRITKFANEMSIEAIGYKVVTKAGPNSYLPLMFRDGIAPAKIGQGWRSNGTVLTAKHYVKDEFGRHIDDVEYEAGVSLYPLLDDAIEQYRVWIENHKMNYETVPPYAIAKVTVEDPICEGKILFYPMRSVDVRIYKKMRIDDDVTPE